MFYNNCESLILRYIYHSKANIQTFRWAHNCLKLRKWLNRQLTLNEAQANFYFRFDGSVRCGLSAPPLSAIRKKVKEFQALMEFQQTIVMLMKVI